MCEAVYFQDESGEFFDERKKACAKNAIYDNQTFKVDIPIILIQRKHRILNNFKSPNLNIDLSFSERESFEQLYQDIINKFLTLNK